MKEHNIGFFYDDEKMQRAKMKVVEELIGKNKSCRADQFDMTTCGTQWITIRCTDEQWEELKFQLDLTEIWVS